MALLLAVDGRKNTSHGNKRCSTMLRDSRPCLHYHLWAGLHIRRLVRETFTRLSCCGIACIINALGLQKMRLY